MQRLPEEVADEVRSVRLEQQTDEYEMLCFDHDDDCMWRVPLCDVSESCEKVNLSSAMLKRWHALKKV